MIVGTAGHIDHGKTALVRALTGVDTDRLKEEKARGISIDLGFAYMPAGDGRTLGFVDVPGHERFVRNMLAGATGIDFVILVVAADDGVMPQTREHLAIVDLLGVSRGLIALTKIDLVSPEWLEAVVEDIRQTLQPTGLASADILPVSSLTGQGVEELRERLLAEARAVQARGVEGRFRLAVDRCFTITGAGTVVTGVVMSGEARAGDSVLVSPSGLRARIRSIHAQNRPAERGRAGERCALNLTGEQIGAHAISRGDVVLDPVLHAPAERIDATLRVLAGEPRPLAHWTAVRLHHAASETPARVALLEEAPIAPGGEGRIQLVLERPIAAAVGDRFVLRTASGSRTLGGGRLVDLRAPHRRRRAPARMEQLEALAIAAPAAALAALLDRPPFFVDLSAFARDRVLSDGQVRSALEGLAHVRISVGEGAVLVSPPTWRRLAQSARTALETFHAAHPELPGLSSLRLAAALEPRLPPPVAAAALEALVGRGLLVSEGGALRTPEHRFGLDGRDEQLWDSIRPLISGDERFRPPRANELAPLVAAQEAEVRRVLKALARRREVVEVAPDHFFRRETVEEMACIAADLAGGASDGQFSAAQLRDRLNNGRKVAIQVLEYFDRRGLTLRRGDLRRIDPARLKAFLPLSLREREGPVAEQWEGEGLQR
jgi:selenocysteine-specific elongation factor